MALRFNFLNFTSVFSLLAACLLVGLFLFPTITYAGDGLVTCGGVDCTFCTLLSTIYEVIRWLTIISALLAGMVLIYAGFKMVTAGGDTSGYVEAKKLFFNAVIGIMIIFAVVAVIYTIMMTILNATVDTVDVRTGKMFGGFDCGRQTNISAPGLSPLNAPPPLIISNRSVTVFTETQTGCSTREGSYNFSTGGCTFTEPGNVPSASVGSTFGCPSSPSQSGDGSSTYNCNTGIVACTQSELGYEVNRGSNQVTCTEPTTGNSESSPVTNNPSETSNQSGTVTGCPGVILPGGICVGGAVAGPSESEFPNLSPEARCARVNAVHYNGQCYTTVNSNQNSGNSGNSSNYSPLDLQIGAGSNDNDNIIPVDTTTVYRINDPANSDLGLEEGVTHNQQFRVSSTPSPTRGMLYVEYINTGRIELIGCDLMSPRPPECR
jgi:hypothetical protein